MIIAVGATNSRYNETNYLSPITTKITPTRSATETPPSTIPLNIRDPHNALKKIAASNYANKGRILNPLVRLQMQVVADKYPTTYSVRHTGSVRIAACAGETNDMVRFDFNLPIFLTDIIDDRTYSRAKIKTGIQAGTCNTDIRN